MGPDKRDVERIEMLGELRGDIKVFQPLVVREISRSGATLETAYPLQLNSLHQVRLAIGDQTVVIDTRVVHSRIRDIDQDTVRYVSGVEFFDAPDRVAEAIAAFLDRIRTERVTGS